MAIKSNFNLRAWRDYADKLQKKLDDSTALQAVQDKLDKVENKLGLKFEAFKAKVKAEKTFYAKGDGSEPAAPGLQQETVATSPAAALRGTTLDPEIEVDTWHRGWNIVPLEYKLRYQKAFKEEYRLANLDASEDAQTHKANCLAHYKRLWRPYNVRLNYYRLPTNFQDENDPNVRRPWTLHRCERKALRNVSDPRFSDPDLEKIRIAPDTPFNEIAKLVETEIYAKMSKRQDFSSEGKRPNDELRIGTYTLGTTLGEGEFGKVKIGWKTQPDINAIDYLETLETSVKKQAVQVAIKIIRREKLDTPSRLGKVRREINILRVLNHPNIVKLHEVVETSTTIGMVLDYASGGELFDYILQQRHLRDPKAKRLFAQLVSGVGYLHRNGIIHRDLKLENLLLDGNNNVVITDFGFANEYNVKELETDSYSFILGAKDNSKGGYSKQIVGDLMTTSCGSPCYAAPELVVNEGLYSGRKCDVWSCGVILYAMLAGYLPFDDDPLNPDGDNISQLYKYICSVKLMFPEHVSAHARDLLQRILVPDPMKRADLFEVARHSWLSDYAGLIEPITSAVPLSSEASSSGPTTSPKTHKPKTGATYAVPRDVESDKPGTKSRSEKRSTVQIEYTEPAQADSKTRQSSALVNQVAPRYREGSRHVDRGPITAIELAANDERVQNAVKRTNSGPLIKNPRRRSVCGNIHEDKNEAYEAALTPLVPEKVRGFRRAPPLTASEARVAAINANGELDHTETTQKPRTAHGRLAMPPAVEGGKPRPTGQHKRSSTLGGLSEKFLTRASSITKRTGGRPEKKTPSKYPPTSMRPFPKNEDEGRQSQDRPSSMRRSFGLTRGKRFTEAYEDKSGAGSSGAARRVMDFFRRRQ